MENKFKGATMLALQSECDRYHVVDITIKFSGGFGHNLTNTHSYFDSYADALSYIDDWRVHYESKNYVGAVVSNLD